MANPAQNVAWMEVGENDVVEEQAHQNHQELASQYGRVLHPQEIPAILSDLLSRVNVRMLLSEEERRRALSIKAAIEACDDLEPLSDMMYAQIAFVDQGDVESAVNRARHLQTFRQEYGVTDTYEQGAAISHAFLKQHPGHMLTMSYNPAEANYAVMYDQATFDDSILRNDQCWKIFIGYGWYLYHAVNPDLHAMR
jgi:hypothetical protein